ncbi:VOC family protein [Acidicapsa ligni]|uniref:VOC family protein n=1 Tax=Acidicapsa ligni TaxID=542300 RepID=UPI0021E04708|nr:VOC family protein [Acidicapsa ligni]
MRLKLAASVSIAAFGCGVLMTISCVAQTSAKSGAHPRPKITGISHLSVYASDMKATDHYYAEIIGAVREPDPENPHGVRYAINATQFVEVLPLPANVGVNRLDHTAYNTENAEGLRLYLKDNGWQTPPSVKHFSDGSKAFRVQDPEGNVVEFVQLSPAAKSPEAVHVIGHHIIHLGIMVHSREAEDKFYKGLLGFRPYWYGGMQQDKLDWVSQQTPDSHDWLEYMLTGSASDSGIPAGMSLQTLGVLDHLSIGVVSVPESYKKLTAENRLTGRTDKHPQIGRDGKYQFNLYDPDGIRLELMEFKAVEKPCCSEFTAEDPRPE